MTDVMHMAGMASETALVPAPGSVRAALPGGGVGYVLGAGTEIDAGPGTERVAQWLRATVGAATGLPLRPHTDSGDRIMLRIEPRDGEDPEAYTLVADGYLVHLRGAGEAGLFYAAQTLRQLLGPDAFRRAPVTPERDWEVPAVSIQDAPRFRWRGLMLDVARHFMPKDGVLRHLDLMAAHKLNVFHFHLTDDQGWRVEIKRYPG